MRFHLGKPGTFGLEIDASESGPLGLLWPEGEPDWIVTARGNAQSNNPRSKAERPLEATEGSELVVELDIPEEWSDEDVIAAVRKLSLKANAYHYALCGEGLRIKRLEIFEVARVPEGSPNG